MDRNKLRLLAGLPVAQSVPQKLTEGALRAPTDLFATGSKQQIFTWLKEHAADYASAMSTLNAAMSADMRAMSADRKGMLETLKADLRVAYNMRGALEPFNSTQLRKMAGLTPIAEDDSEESEEEFGPAEEQPTDPAAAPEAAEMIAQVAANAEGKTGEEMVTIIQQVYDAGFQDGQEAVAAPEEAEEEPVEEAVDAKGKEIKAGSRLIWKDVNGEHTGTVEADPKYNGGLKVGGRSVKNIIDDADSVMVVEAARKPKAPVDPNANITSSIGVDKEDDAGWMAVELAKAGMTVDMEEAMGVFYFNFKNKADEAKAKKLAAKLQVATV